MILFCEMIAQEYLTSYINYYEKSREREAATGTN